MTAARVPLVSLGQGDYRRDFYAADFGRRPSPAQAEASSVDTKTLEAEFVGAALRYVAVADWFEHLPFARHDPDREARAMDTFNRIEHALREAGGRLLRRCGTRQLILEHALREFGS